MIFSRLAHVRDAGRLLRRRAAIYTLSRAFSARVALLAVKSWQLPARVKVEEADIEEKFLKGSGPGGQKINKTSSAVQLHHVPTGMVVKCQATRSRTQNRKIARQMLGEKLEDAEKGDESRSAIKAGIKSKKKASKKKKSNRKYRALKDTENNDRNNIDTENSGLEAAEEEDDEADDDEDAEGEGDFGQVDSLDHAEEDDSKKETIQIPNN